MGFKTKIKKEEKEEVRTLFLNGLIYGKKDSKNMKIYVDVPKRIKKIKMSLDQNG